MKIPSTQEIIDNKLAISHSWVRKRYPGFYDYLQSTYPGLRCAEQLYRYFYGGPGVCECGNETKFENFIKGYKKFCSARCKCARKSAAVKSSQTKQDRYGDPNYNNRQSAMETCLSKYGETTATRASVSKIKQTKQERYGDPNYNNIEQGKQTTLQRHGTLDFSDKIKQTKQERYGDPNYNNHDQISITKQERYGDPNYNNRHKASETMLLRYGDHCRRIPEIINKQKYTCAALYGGVGYASEELNQKAVDTLGYPNIKHKIAYENNPDLIEINGLVWICKCPDVNCTLCNEKQYETTSQLHYGRKTCNCDQCTIRNPIGSQIIGVSKISQQIFSEIDKYFEEYTTFYAVKNHEHRIGPYSLDYYIKELNVCIEFNGDMWHANPRIYSATDKPNPYFDLTAKQIQEKDYKRYKYLNERGIVVYVIWQDDWKNHRISIEEIVEVIKKENL